MNGQFLYWIFLAPKAEDMVRHWHREMNVRLAIAGGRGNLM
jgi:hypothetical protein